jgi:hypothetical protein
LERRDEDLIKRKRERERDRKIAWDVRVSSGESCGDEILNSQISRVDPSICTCNAIPIDIFIISRGGQHLMKGDDERRKSELSSAYHDTWTDP